MFSLFKTRPKPELRLDINFFPRNSSRRKRNSWHPKIEEKLSKYAKNANILKQNVFDFQISLQRIVTLKKYNVLDLLLFWVTITTKHVIFIGKTKKKILKNSWKCWGSQFSSFIWRIFRWVHRSNPINWLFSKSPTVLKIY